MYQILSCCFFLHAILQYCNVCHCNWPFWVTHATPNLDLAMTSLFRYWFVFTRAVTDKTALASESHSKVSAPLLPFITYASQSLEPSVGVRCVQTVSAILLTLSSLPSLFRAKPHTPNVSWHFLFRLGNSFTKCLQSRSVFLGFWEVPVGPTGICGNAAIYLFFILW